jgi:hypothetical protein
VLLRAVSHAASGRVIGAAPADVPPAAGLSVSLSSSGGRQEFHCLIHEADEAHRLFYVATHEARRLELALDATKAVLAASEGETVVAQAVTADA